MAGNDHARYRWPPHITTFQSSSFILSRIACPVYLEPKWLPMIYDADADGMPIFAQMLRATQ